MNIPFVNFCFRKCDIINRGFSGYNTRWARLILPRLVNMDLAKDISAMTIFLGTNDSSLPTNPRRHVPLDEYVGNLVDMVDYLTVSMSRDLLLGDDALLHIVRFTDTTRGWVGLDVARVFSTHCLCNVYLGCTYPCY